MSRTIRRTKTTKRYSRIPKDYTECKRFSPWRFHSDSGLPQFGFEKAFCRPWEEDHGCRRVRWKNQINRWLKNEEYEIILQRPKSMWDYY